MSETYRWLSAYGASHSDIGHPGIYWLSVPILLLGTVGVLWSLPVPDEFARVSPVLNWGSVFLMAATVYYFVISVSLAIGMLPFVAGMCAIQIWLNGSPWSLRWISLGMIGASICGLYLGRFRKGGARAVLADIQLMIIGPAWLLANLMQRIGIPV